jgi:hypothetical protein
MAPDPSLGNHPRQGPDPRQAPVPRQSRASGSEVVRWPFLALLLPFAPLLLLVLSALEPPQRRSLLLLDEKPVVSLPFQLDSSWLGSPHLELTTDVPPNSSAVLLVNLLNSEGQTVLTLSKDAWRERETWVEEGESGTEEAADVGLPLELRPARSGDFQLRVAAEERLDAAGQPLATPLRASLSVRNHSVDAPLMLATGMTGALMVALLWASVYGHCRSWQRVRVADEWINLRLVAGGAGLLRLKLRVRYSADWDRGPTLRPASSSLRLRIEDRIGRRRLDTALNPPWMLRRVGDGDPFWERDQVLWFRLGEPDALRLRIDASASFPDSGAELEWLEVVVADGVVVPDARKVSELSPRPGDGRVRSGPAPESLLILGLAMAAVLSGSLAATTRPTLYRLGQDGTPAASSGVTFLGSGRSGRWRSPGRHADWSRFPGRGPGAAK